MELLLAILVWLQVMSPEGQYTQAEFNHMVQANETQINMILTDPVQTETVWASTGNNIPAVIVGSGE